MLKVKINLYNHVIMNRFDKTFLYFLFFCWLIVPLVGQEDQKFSVLLNNHISGAFQKKDSFFDPDALKEVSGKVIYSKPFLE